MANTTNNLITPGKTICPVKYFAAATYNPSVMVVPIAERPNEIGQMCRLTISRILNGPKTSKPNKDIVFQEQAIAAAASIRISPNKFAMLLANSRFCGAR